jgi:hypothetical protein
MKRWLIGATLALTLPGHAFVLSTDGGDNFQHWRLTSATPGVSTNVINLNTRAVRYFLASDGYSATNTAAELNAVRAAFGQWMAVSNSLIKFEEGGLVSAPVDVNTDDDTNIVYWTKSTTLVNGGLDDIGGALGVCFRSWLVSDLSLTHADIVFNGVNYAWFTDPSDPTTTKQLVDGVALHEIGHLFGLNHSPLGGATMFWRGSGGVNPQTGLHADDFGGVRFLYPTNASLYGALNGTVLKDGLPVHGATVTAYDSGTNAIAGTLTRPDGSYQLFRLPPGNYRLRVTPLDSNGAAQRLCAGYDVDFEEYGSADISFLPTATTPATVTANATNTVAFSVVNSSPALRISRIVRPATSLAAFSYSGVPVQIRAGVSNLYVGVASTTLPTSGATFLVTGDGLTVGAPTYYTGSGLNFIFATLKVSSNATPGLRDFIVTNNTGAAYAPGYLTILPTVTDDNFDGLDDNFQRTYWAPFTAASAAPNANPDGDPFANAAEFIAGTVPTNAASFFKLTTVSHAAGSTTLRWLGSVGKKYQVSARTNLGAAPWMNLGSVQTTTNYLDTTASNTLRYYRVQAVP